MEIVEGTIRYYPSKKITMWNVPLPFKRGLHIEFPSFEIGLYNWNTCGYHKLLKIHKTHHKDNITKLWIWTPLLSMGIRYA